jgi:hypothetical protein
MDLLWQINFEEMLSGLIVTAYYPAERLHRGRLLDGYVSPD